MIDIDTERLYNLVDMLSVANERIDEAAALLMQITTHHDWGCKERYVINDDILDNRKNIQRLQEDGHSFLAAVKMVANEFSDTENSISEMFSTLEGMISRILANPVSSKFTNFPHVDLDVGKLAGNIGLTTGVYHTGSMYHQPFRRISEDVVEDVQNSKINLHSSSVPGLGLAALLQPIAVTSLDDLDL